MKIDTTDIPMDDVSRDIDVILWSIKLQHQKRYFHMRFWENETRDSEYTDRIETKPRLESVADHSWHITDIVILLAKHYPVLSIERCLKIAILHDKIEIIVGDKSPLGRDGTGLKSHGFNRDMEIAKSLDEQQALKTYLRKLRTDIREEQKNIFMEYSECKTNEALFVKALDKLQTLAYIFWKKNGNLEDQHLLFSLRYSAKCMEYFPPLEQHYFELRKRFLLKVAKYRNISLEKLESCIKPIQLDLFGSNTV